MGLASPGVKTLFGADKEGSGEAATSSGVRRAHKETLMATWTWGSTAGTGSVAGALPLPGDWVPKSCPPN